uniref:RING-CH-type domain-containing protein n=1 Tax=Rhabditophanes sp. KR3021 TaxID=114890 RepID=A0AC35TYG9_9BILA
MNNNEGMAVDGNCQENMICELCGESGKSIEKYGYEPSNGNACFSPCDCNTFVHYKCWLNYWYSHSEDWLHFCKKCTVLYQFDFSKKINSQTHCDICKKQHFMNFSKGPYGDNRFIRPCKCSKKVHHACIVSVYDNIRKCEICHQKPILKTYGSMWDLVKKYSCTTITLMLLLITGLCLLYTYIYYILGDHAHPYRHLIFYLFSLVYIIGICLAAWTLLGRRYNKFRNRYFNVVVIEPV